MDYIAQELATERGFLELGLDPAIMAEHSPTGEWEWAPFQLAYFDIPGWFITNKCRQGGGSLMLAAKYFAKGILAKNNYNGIFISYKREEAIGKINYVRMFLNALPPRFKKKIIRDPQHLIEFENQNGTRVKLTSHAQKPVRGSNGDVGADEMAFMVIAEEIYKSALPATASVGGNFDVISTPFGKNGMYYELQTDRVKYPKFARMPIMWWHVPRYVRQDIAKDPKMFMRIAVEAYKLETEDRVMMLGSKSIQDQFLNSDLETFKQEFEGFYVDARARFFSKELIFSCTYNDIVDISEYDPREDDFTIDVNEALREELSPIERRYHDVRSIDGRPIVFKKFDTIEELLAARAAGVISYNLYGAADIGTTYHSTYFTILEEIILAGGETLQIVRFTLNRTTWDLSHQQDYFENFLKNGILRKFGSDSNGIGLQMAQHFDKHYPDKYVMFKTGSGTGILDAVMTNLKARMESGRIAITNDKVLIDDLYSIQRIVSVQKTVSYKADERKKHHGDGGWSIGFASFLGTPSNERAFNFGSNTAKVMNNEDQGIVGSRNIITVDNVLRNVNLSGTGLGMFDSNASALDGYIHNFDE